MQGRCHQSRRRRAADRGRLWPRKMSRRCSLARSARSPRCWRRDPGRERMNSLDLGIIGNCTISALIDKQGDIVWSCFPRFDGDPVFNKLLNNGDDSPRVCRASSWMSWKRSSRPILRTPPSWSRASPTSIRRWRRDHRLRAALSAVRPHLQADDPGTHHPPLRRDAQGQDQLSARPSTTVRASPRSRAAAIISAMSDSDTSLRLTTNAPLTYLLDETPFILKAKWLCCSARMRACAAR